MTTAPGSVLNTKCIPNQQMQNSFQQNINKKSIVEPFAMLSIWSFKQNKIQINFLLLYLSLVLSVIIDVSN